MDTAPKDHEARKRTEEFWQERHSQSDPADTLLAHPMIEAYTSIRAFGDLRGHLGVAIAELKASTAPGAQILSIGCGFAAKERALSAALPDRNFVGIDLTQRILEQVREQVRSDGVTNLELQHGDFNQLDLRPDSFDAVLALGALHHVEALEDFWQQARRALRPGGFVLAQEYVGPSRFQWTAAQIEHGDAALRDLVPQEHRTHHDRVAPVDLDRLIAADPSEAVRSAEILPTCDAAGFDRSRYHGGGCSLVQPVLWGQIGTFDANDWSHNQVLFSLFAAEDKLIRDGRLGDQYAMFVAVPG